MARFVTIVALLLLSAVASSLASSDSEAAIAKAREAQNSVENLRDDLTRKMVQMEEEYFQKQQPLFKERNERLAHLAGFWLRVIENHPTHSAFVRGNDKEVLKHLTDVHVEHDTGADGTMASQAHQFRIVFTFENNPYFSDNRLWRRVFPGDTNVEVSGVNWASGQQPKEASFFNFFEKHPSGHPGDGGETTEPEQFVNFLDHHTLSDMGHIFRHELWTNPFTFYDIPSMEEAMNQHVVGGEAEPTAENYEDGEAPLEPHHTDHEMPIHDEAGKQAPPPHEVEATTATTADEKPATNDRDEV